jgi:hypothetical protein
MLVNPIEVIDLSVPLHLVLPGLGFFRIGLFELELVGLG